MSVYLLFIWGRVAEWPKNTCERTIVAWRYDIVWWDDWYEFWISRCRQITKNDSKTNKKVNIIWIRETSKPNKIPTNQNRRSINESTGCWIEKSGKSFQKDKLGQRYFHLFGSKQECFAEWHPRKSKFVIIGVKGWKWSRESHVLQESF